MNRSFKALRARAAAVPSHGRGAGAQRASKGLAERDEGGGKVFGWAQGAIPGWVERASNKKLLKAMSSLRDNVNNYLKDNLIKAICLVSMWSRESAGEAPHSPGCGRSLAAGASDRRPGGLLGAHGRRPWRRAACHVEGRCLEAIPLGRKLQAFGFSPYVVAA